MENFTKYLRMPETYKEPISEQITTRDESIDDDGYTKSTLDEMEITKSKTKTITASNFLEYKINCFATDLYIKSLNTDFNIMTKKYPQQFQYDYDKYEEIYTSGIVIVIYKNKIHYFEKTHNILSITIQGDYADEIYKELTEYIKENNILRNKQIHVSFVGGNDIEYKLTKPKKVTFDEVIINKAMKDDIVDNVIFHLDNLDGCNGVILHGLTGTGKSITCAASVNEVIKKGYSACFITNTVNFSKLEDFLDKFLSPCLLIFEDIDAMGQSRTETLNTNISPLLQFLNGLSEKSGKYVFMATTNHIEQLDAALVNRPIRFNRKYEFKLPNNKNLDRMIDLYFKDCGITDEMKKLIHKTKFTGAHIEELKRTCEMQVIKYGVKYSDIFENCVDIIKKNFDINAAARIGFGADIYEMDDDE